MNYLSVENLTKSYDENILFQGMTFGLDQGQKCALVGVNGSGKSTMLKIIAGLEEPDKGLVSIRKDIKISFLNQSPQFAEDLTVLQAIFDHESEELGLIRDYELALLKQKLNPEKAVDLTNLIEEIDRLNAWEYEHQVKELLGKLGIQDFNKKVKELSGGQQKRVALAQSLVVRPDLLILDEPTNHLDIEIIEWLENYLSGQNLTLLMVTHDRYFLDRVTNSIIEIDDGQLRSYSGNYSTYLEKKEQQQLELESKVSKAQNLYKKELEWMRRQPKARGTKAKYRVDAFKEVKSVALQNTRKDKLEIKLGQERQGKKILELHHLNFSFGEQKIISDFNYVFKKKDRIGIVGPNGVGKSTFLKIITQQIDSNSGKIEIGQNTSFGFYTQEEYSFNPDQKVIDCIKEVAEFIKLDNGSEVTASQLLNQFLFPPKKQHQYLSKLSGGEKRRLQLLRVLISNPNFLIFDEPTNDLDILTLNVLEEYLSSYSGCLLIVSHDRYFMDRLVDHVFVMKGKGEVKDFPGNYTDYRGSEHYNSTRLKEEKARVEPQAQKKSTFAKNRNKLSFNEKREFESLEKDLSELEQKKLMLEEELSKTTDYQELQEKAKSLENVKEELDMKELRWLELSEKV